MKANILHRVAAVVFIVALSVGSALAEPDGYFIVEQKAEVPDSFVLPVGGVRCESCGRVLGAETSESFLSKDPDFKRDNTFQTCQGCLDRKMDAQPQITFAGGVVAQELREVKKDMSPGGLTPRGILLVSRTPPARANARLTPRGILLVSHTPPVRADAGSTPQGTLLASRTPPVRANVGLKLHDTPPRSEVISRALASLIFVKLPLSSSSVPRALP